MNKWVNGLEHMKDELDSLQQELDYFNSQVTPETFVVPMNDLPKMIKVSVLREDLTELNKQISSHKSLIKDLDDLVKRYHKAKDDIIKRRRKLFIRKSNE